MMRPSSLKSRRVWSLRCTVASDEAIDRGLRARRRDAAGQRSRVVLTHDVAQRDNLRVGRHDGVAAVVEKLKGNPLFGHVTLTRSERSPIAALVTDLLEEYGY